VWPAHTLRVFHRAVPHFPLDQSFPPMNAVAMATVKKGLRPGRGHGFFEAAVARKFAEGMDLSVGPKPGPVKAWACAQMAAGGPYHVSQGGAGQLPLATTTLCRRSPSSPSISGVCWGRRMRPPPAYAKVEKIEKRGAILNVWRNAPVLLGITRRCNRITRKYPSSRTKKQCLDFPRFTLVEENRRFWRVPRTESKNSRVLP